MRARLLLVSVWFLLTAPALVGAEGSKWEWEGVSRIIALGDVHGSYEKLLSLLQGTKLIDDELAWIGGNQHLVFCGDLTDRGTNDRAVLDMARRLQKEAEAADGKVHVVLGNHDVMNLTRDRRYWTPELLSGFAKDETEEERLQGFRQFQRQHGQQVERGIRAFDEKFPPGYFARARAFDPDGEYGSWLLEQPTVVKVNGVLFLHGGLTPRVAKRGLDEINRLVTADIRAFLEAADALGDSVPWPRDYGTILGVAHELGERRGKSPKVTAAKTVLEAQEGLAFEPAGPVWYRGTSVDNERLENQLVDEVLELLNARAEMVGHTVTRSGQISSRFNGQVYRADVGMSYGRPALAAVLQGENLHVYNPANGALMAAYTEPPQGEGWPQGEEDLSDHQLERFLERAEIKDRKHLEKEGVPLMILELEHKDMKLQALFGYAQESAEEAAADNRKTRRMYQNVVAAYRLDRLFDLHMVPVTVLRKVDGTNGAIQIWIQSALDLTEIEEYEAEDLLEKMLPEIARARAFSGLIGLKKRLKFGVNFLPVTHEVKLADNGIAFSEDPDIGDFLTEGCGPVGEAFLHSLETLEYNNIKDKLGEFLSKEQIEAILKRRDGILEICINPDPDWSVDRVRNRDQT